MTDLDERIRTDLLRLVTRAPLPPSVEEILDARPSSVVRRRRPVLVALVAAAVTLLAAAASIVLTQNGGDQTSEVATEGTPEPFTDLAPDSTVSLPDVPLSDRSVPSAVWTGTEIIVWGGIPDDGPAADDGAAYNPATDTWRVLAAAPIAGRAYAAAAWTGSEMIVWGGQSSDGRSLADGAAYNPTTDSWRRLPEAPLDPSYEKQAVWTGDELILLGGETGTQTAAYVPATNEWRRLADAPEIPRLWATGDQVWTGPTILQTYVTQGSPDARPLLARYDLSTDTWHLDEDAGYLSLVGIPDADGVTRTAIGVPLDTGDPVDVLDDTGDPIGHLPGYPGELETLDEVEGTWLGDEARFWIRGDAWQLIDEDTEAWALDPDTGAWRPLPPDTVSGRPEVTIGDDIVFAWTHSPDRPARDAVVYRAPTGSPG